LIIRRLEGNKDLRLQNYIAHKTNTKDSHKNKSISLKKKFAKSKVNAVAKQIGFKIRKPKKLSDFCLITLTIMT